MMSFSIVRVGLPACLAATLTIAAPAAAQTAVADATAAQQPVSEIVVTGTRADTHAASGTKSDTPLIETPQSITVITSQQIQDLGLANLDQALRYVSGVTTETRGVNAEFYDLFKLRGFDAPRYLDGLKVFTSPTGYADTQVDLSRLDRFEVVKGPASVLYGQSSPGGLVAMSSKLPLNEDYYGSARTEYGSDNLYRVDGDVGGKIAPGALVRLYGSVNGADTQQTFGERQRQTFSAAGTIGADSDTTLTLLTAYSHDPYNGNYGSVPALGSAFANPNGQIKTDLADGEPGDRFQREQVGVTYILTHRFDENWSARASGRYQFVSTDLGAIYQTGIPIDTTLTTFRRASYASQEHLNNWTFDNQLIGKVTTGPVDHSLLFGLDQQVTDSKERAAFGGTSFGDIVTPINAYDPVYGTVRAPLTPDDIGGAANYIASQRQTGFYMQDQLALGDFRLTLSGRQDWAHTVSSGVAQDDEKFTYRMGALYLTPFGIAPYASYSTSFEPQIGNVIHSGGTVTGADPSEGRQIEAGLKYQMPGTQMLITAAWFQIEQTNLLTGVPASSFSTQTGAVRSEGYEVEATVPLPLGFLVKGVYGYQDVKTIKDAENPANVGRGLIGDGKGNAALNVDWAPADGKLEGLKIGGGLRWSDKVYGGVVNAGDFGGTVAPGNVWTPSFTVFDALLRYDMGRADERLKGIEMGLNANNILDKKYINSCYVSGIGWCWYGQRRTVLASLGVHW